MDPDSNRLEVSITDRLGRAVPAPGVAGWLRRVAPASARGELSIALVSDRAIRTFNRTYRGKDRPTDVLSFPSAHHHAPSTRHAALSTRHAALNTPHLGDIVIATGVARRQAHAAAHSYTTELKVLALHGLLHLLGYDHHDPADRGRMARVERALRRKGGLPAGLIERAVADRRR